MRLSLRDLFWLIVIAAIGLAWGLEHLRVAAAFANAERSYSHFHYEDIEGETRRRELQSRLQKLSNDELVTESAGKERIDEREPYWLEMSQRRMVAELRQIYQEAGNQPSLDPNDPPETKAKDASWDNGRLLTALRRAEGKPDPIRIEIVSLGKDLQGNRVSQPVIIPKVTNVDIDREPCLLSQNGDDRGSRHERWRVHLTSSKGELMEDAGSFGSFGGLGSWGMLRYGEVVQWKDQLDAKNYVKGPPTGRYSLELLHAERYLAHDREMTGRIVWKSAPVAVIVENYGLNSKWVSARLPFAIFVPTLLVCIVSFVRQRFWKTERPLLTGRDRFALAIIVLMSAGWCSDIFLMKKGMENQDLDFSASWTMRLAD